ncbi:MAG: hypothetical protein KDD21_01790 [Bacteroidetes bacterium]|nr:hypothetical protein [Bacteroidota bacterium]
MNKNEVRKYELSPKYFILHKTEETMDTIFWICVKIMQVMSDMLGITYQQLNVILFVILHPLITLFLFLKYRKYKKLWEDAQVKLNENK